MDDLCKTVVVIRRFREDAIVVAECCRRARNDRVVEEHRKLYRGEELARLSCNEFRNARRVVRNEGELGGDLRGICAVGSERDIHVTTVRDQSVAHFDRRAAHEAKPRSEAWLAQAVRVHLTPADRVR